MKVLKFFKSMIEKANLKGAYTLEEAHSGYESYEHIVSNFIKISNSSQQTYTQEHLNNCLNVLVNLLQKGQSKGSYSLEEASQIFAIFQEIGKNGLHIKPDTETDTNTSPINENQPSSSKQPVINDISDLTEDLPLSD